MSLSPARGKGVQKKVNAKFAAGAPEVAAVQLLPHRNSLSFVGFGKSAFVPDAHGTVLDDVFASLGILQFLDFLPCRSFAVGLLCDKTCR